MKTVIFKRNLQRKSEKSPSLGVRASVVTLWIAQSGLDQQESAYIPPLVCFVQAVDDEDDDDNDRLQRFPKEMSERRSSLGGRV